MVDVDVNGNIKLYPLARKLGRKYGPDLSANVK
jgi:hypothetical protein